MPLTIATPEHDRERGQHRAELAPEQALQREPDHARDVELVHRREHLGGLGARELVHDQAVGEEEDPVGDRGRVRVVGDHHDRLAVARRAQSRSSSRISLPVVESRLPVGSSAKHDRRLRDERAGDRDALLLAAGELRRAVLAPLRRARPFEQVVEPRLVGLLAGDRERQLRRSPPRSASGAGCRTGRRSRCAPGAAG